MSESDPPSTTLSLRIKTLAAELPGIDILASATVLELKRRIIEEHIEQPASKRVQLVMLQQTDRANCVLLSDDSQTLKTYNLINGAELSLIIETLPPITEIDMPVLMRAVSARDEGSLTRFLAMRAGALNLSLMNLNFEAISIGTIVTKLCKALTSNRTITSLNLEQVKYQHHQKPREADRRAYGRWDGHAYIIHNTSVIELAEALKHNTTITELNLKNHMIGPDGVNAIIEMLKVNSTIRSLQLSNNVMQYANDKITQLLVDAMRNRSAFTLLGIVGFKTSDSIISQLLAPDSKLLQLEVDVYARDDQRICNLLISNTSVTDLELGFVGGYHPESSLGKMISLNSTITSLNLSKNGLFDIGTTALAQAMKCNVSITSLILQHDKIQSEAAGCAIASLLTDNSRIVKRSNIWI